MKKFAFRQAALLVPCLGMMATLAPAAETEPPAALPRVHAAPAAPAASPAAASGVVIRATPIQDYWNAHSWDPIGGSLFWHDPSEKHREALSERNARRPAVRAAPPVRPPATSGGANR